MTEIVAWESNPFATRFIRPGALPYLFPDGEGTNPPSSDAISPAGLLASLQANRWMGQIIGPHGSGKSTLLATLCERLVMERGSIRSITLSSDARPPRRLVEWRAGEAVQIVIDGFEQLSVRQRRRAIRQCRTANCGLLVTAHSDVGLPTLFETDPQLPLTQRIVSRLVEGSAQVLSPSMIAELHRRHYPDIREMLFCLYDLFEQQRQANH